MKLSTFTVATPDLTPEMLAAKARELGIHGIEWRYKDTPPEVAKEEPSFWGNNLCTLSPAGGDEQIARFKQASEAAGVPTLSVTPYLAAGDLAGTEQVLSAARELGASYIRLGVPSYNRTRPFPALFEEARSYLKAAEPLCRQYGVKGLIETHHVTIAPSASAAYRLVDGLDPDHVGVLYDPGNLVHEGFENYRMGLELLGPYLAHVHVKNAGWFAEGEPAGELGEQAWSARWTGVRDGIVPWGQLIADLRSVGYDGYLGIEDFSRQYETEQMLRETVQYLNALLGETARA
ncbi:sugar phosphate isomerase/epimerase family protein [Paenibacillus sp. 1P07SE]|uniref:sugar phosphate isomerase/epimerase family protein n=1 Tax=Paenibacillus sp. 1P07SE TaxID=3132209 RepID=UPI0039A73CD3